MFVYKGANTGGNSLNSVTATCRLLQICVPSCSHFSVRSPTHIGWEADEIICANSGRYPCLYRSYSNYPKEARIQSFQQPMTRKNFDLDTLSELHRYQIYLHIPRLTTPTNAVRIKSPVECRGAKFRKLTKSRISAKLAMKLFSEQTLASDLVSQVALLHSNRNFSRRELFMRNSISQQHFFIVVKEFQTERYIWNQHPSITRTHANGIEIE